MSLASAIRKMIIIIITQRDNFLLRRGSIHRTKGTKQQEHKETKTWNLSNVNKYAGKRRRETTKRFLYLLLFVIAYAWRPFFQLAK